MRGGVLTLLGLAVCLQAAACGRARSVTSSSGSSVPPPPAIAVQITGGSVQDGHVVARYRLTRNGQGIGGTEAAALRPSWTLARLGTDPVSNVPAWLSLLLTGGETLPVLPIDGPGTPDAFVLTDTKQPGTDGGGTVKDLGGGEFTYTYGTALPQALDPNETLRVGVWLGGTPGTPATTSTFDFTPSGAAVQSRELVLASNCNHCHGTIQAHGGFRTGTRICVTCHTVQNADAETVDPAALSTATAATNPNPLDLGRFVHRLHRGQDLPTLYAAATGQPVVGQTYSIVGYQSARTVYGRIVSETSNQQPAMSVAVGVAFPQDLRACLACHEGAPQAGARFTYISRRTCSGCHPDVWFLSTPIPAGDVVHALHAGGPQPDDSQCASCHLPTPEHPTVVADITAIHVPLRESPHWSGITATIVGVEGMKPGETPTVVFTLTDRDGVLSPLQSPTPSTDPSSPVPRALSTVNITVSGPTTPDYLTGNTPQTEAVPLTLAADAQGQFRYTFENPIRSDASGTWAVAMEARRSAATATGSWPYTGETVEEWADNPVVYVDLTAGTYPGGNPTPRRQVVDRALCNACHGDLSAHGGLRHNPEYCVMCHTPDGTDWIQRPKNAAGNTDLSKTYDDIEERSIHFKYLIHHIHTGSRTGSAELGLDLPFVVYGFRGSVNFLGDVEFPGDLARCTLCHVDRSYRIEAIPAQAVPTIANENGTLLHHAEPAPVPSEPALPPVTAACMGCHYTGAALAHARSNTLAGKENCKVCHGRIGFVSVDQVHGLGAQ